MDCPDEKTLLAFAEGRLPRAESDAVDAHARACLRCPERISAALGAATLTTTATFAGGAQVRPRALPDVADALVLPRGTSIGRYTVLGLVGRGGMGEVYAAYDPELDRKVALKLLLGASGGDERSRARLLREAKAIAKVSHANVIVVHDAGTFGDRIFVAMEFVDGITLKAWLDEEPRTRREILAVFGGAARGLAAAHAAGLVHRDFKPHNVMVGKNGDVRVMDFGLAREVQDVTDDLTDDPTADAADPDALPGDLALTRTGDLVGTPLYMAPEQFRALRTDARTDQFSFCVALYQALYGAHPFGGGTIEDLAMNVLAGAVQPPPGKHDVPAWLRRVLLRGLALEPAARWPSMAALLEALEQDPARARRRWGATAGVALLVVAAAVTLVRGPRRAGSLCRGGPARLAGVWEPPASPGTPRPRRDALEVAFLRAGDASAPETWRRVEALLDRYAASWLAMYRDSCEATHVRGEQSPETLDLRMTCLDERRTALGALTGVLTNADGVAVSRAVDAIAALPSIDRCADIKLLRESVEPPRDEATRARAEDIRGRLATAKALHDTGRHAEARAQTQSLIAEARALGYRSLLAEVLCLSGKISNGPSFRADVVKDLEESVWTALAVRRDDVAAEAGARLAADTGAYLARPEEGERWARLTNAILDRMGPGHELIRAWLLQSEGLIKQGQRDYAASLAFFQRALALKQKVLPPDHPDLALSLSALAEQLHRLGRDEEALAMSRRAQETDVRAYGPNASVLWLDLSNQGEYLVALGRAREAVPVFEGVLARCDASGFSAMAKGYPLTGLGQARLALGEPQRARAPLEQALRVREANEADPTVVAETRFALARALWDADGERPRARRLASEARDAYAHATDAPHREAVDAWLARRR